ncbi:hypothetical protein D3C71_1330920 [compost metagenome]
MGNTRPIGIADQALGVRHLRQREARLHQPLAQLRIHQHQPPAPVAVQFVDHLRQRLLVEYQPSLPPGRHDIQIHPDRRLHSRIVVAQLPLGPHIEHALRMHQPRRSRQAAQPGLAADIAQVEDRVPGRDPALARHHFRRHRPAADLGFAIGKLNDGAAPGRRRDIDARLCVHLHFQRAAQGQPPLFARRRPIVRAQIVQARPQTQGRPERQIRRRCRQRAAQKRAPAVDRRLAAARPGACSQLRAHGRPQVPPEPPLVGKGRLVSGTGAQPPAKRVGIGLGGLARGQCQQPLPRLARQRVIALVLVLSGHDHRQRHGPSS